MIVNHEYTHHIGTVTDMPTELHFSPSNPPHPSLEDSVWVDFGEASGLPIAAFHSAELEAVP
jgi:hypothetical protein